MRHSIATALLAGTVVVAGFSAASAQSVGVEVYGGDRDYYAYGYDGRYDTSPRVYGYRSEPAVVVPVRPSSCGEYRYWNGARCADARITPPDIR